MKANKKVCGNKEAGITSALGTILILPVVMLLIVTLVIWSQSVFAEIDDSNRTLDDMKSDLNNNPIDVNVTLTEGEIVWMDDFEGEKQWYEVYYTGSYPSHLFGDPYIDTFDFTHDEIFYTKGHSLQLKIDLNPDIELTAGVYKKFANQEFGKTSIEIHFTINKNDRYKNFSIYQYETNVDNENNYNNHGIISLDIKNNKLLIFDGENDIFITFAENINFEKGEHCWHHMRLIVDFEVNDYNIYSHYVSFTLDDEYYALGKYDLKNPTYKGIRSNAVCVEYSTNVEKINPGAPKPNNKAVSFVDDFIFRDLGD